MQRLQDGLRLIRRVHCLMWRCLDVHVVLAISELFGSQRRPLLALISTLCFVWHFNSLHLQMFQRVHVFIMCSIRDRVRSVVFRFVDWYYIRLDPIKLRQLSLVELLHQRNQLVGTTFRRIDDRGLDCLGSVLRVKLEKRRLRLAVSHFFT